jgi:REP element-mobilizing transposase RayT
VAGSKTAPHIHAGWRSRGYLPHVDAAGAIQHIVFRLADSLPVDLMARLEAMPAQGRMQAAAGALDDGIGSRVLADPAIAKIVQSALLHFDAERYRLVAWCIMPNHVHVLAEQTEGWPLSQITHAWKSFTAKTINKALGRTGRLWAPEYYDRYMRDDGQFEATRDYIEMNPVTAGLCATPDEWRWSSASAVS